MNERIKTQISPDGMRYKNETHRISVLPQQQRHAGCCKCGLHKPVCECANRWLCGKKMLGCLDCYPQAIV